MEMAKEIVLKLKEKPAESENESNQEVSSAQTKE